MAQVVLACTSSETLAAVAAAVVDGWPPPSDELLQRIASRLLTANINPETAQLEAGGTHAA